MEFQLNYGYNIYKQKFQLHLILFFINDILYYIFKSNFNFSIFITFSNNDLNQILIVMIK